MTSLTPRAIVAELDRFIVGQAEAKRAVAIAVRNRWRRRQLDPALRDEVYPKNIVMIGSTGIGKTEIARRLASLVKAPFIKVEASRFTEVGYHGRDVESMIRDLTDIAVSTVRAEHTERIEATARQRVDSRILDYLVQDTLESDPDDELDDLTDAPAWVTQKPGRETTHMQIVSYNNHDSDLDDDEAFEKEFEEEFGDDEDDYDDDDEDDEDEDDEDLGDDDEVEDGEDRDDDKERRAAEERARRLALTASLSLKLEAGDLDDDVLEIQILERPVVMAEVLGPAGVESLGMDFQNFFEKSMPTRSATKRFTVREARQVLFEEEAEKLLDRDRIVREARERVEQSGLVFLDEIDKVTGSRSEHGPDVSREGVQKDLLPIVEGTTVTTRHGMVRTDHILFVAAGAFSTSKPSDLMPELQGRFPIRVELNDLGEKDLVRILTEPENALPRQYRALLATEEVDLKITDEALEEIAAVAHRVNSTGPNIGARRLATVMEKLLEEVSFHAPDLEDKQVVVDRTFVQERLKDVIEDEDLSRFIL